MEWIDRLNKSIAYIEQNLTAKIDYHKAAQICCCSLSKYQQIFLLATGISVSEYVRCRRMTLAAHELIHTGIKIIDLAFMFDYDSPEAFTRAYQSFHGVPPSVTRKSGVFEEYERIVFQIQVYGGKAKMGSKAILRIETERLIIRKFTPDDWKDLQEIAISKERSKFADCDHAWPTDDNGIKSIIDYFSKEHPFWAVEVKDIKKVVCFVNFNFMDDEKTLDIGHVMNSDYCGNDYEYEALKALYNLAFINLGAERIQAAWALNDKEKLAPLEKLGMKIVKKFMEPRFRPNPDGTTSEFEACILAISKEEWLTNPVI